MRRLLTLMAVLTAVVTSALAVRTASGYVYSVSDDQPVIGASVMVKGTTLGTATDIDGNFVIKNIPDNATTLVVKFVGMHPVEVGIGTDLRIGLTDSASDLDEVMVVAYGTANKATFTGSAATVSAETIEKMQVSNISKALEGTAPGVQVAMASGQPGTSATVRVRGIGSINSSAAPLYVVDGMPYDGNLNALNTADIESMSVLKDAASTALYGSRAANGVIIITTKKGSSRKSKVTVDARWGQNSRGISNYDIMTDPGMFVMTNWTLLKNQSDGATASKDLIGRIGTNPFNCPADAIVSPDGVLTTAALKWNDDWTKAAIQNGFRQEYNVTVSGGNDKSNHFLSVGYLGDDGIIRNSDFNRLSMRASGDYNVTNWLKINGNVAYARSEQNALNISSLSNYTNTFAFIQNLGPIYPVYAYDKNGQPVYDADGNRVYDFGNGEYSLRPYSSNVNVVASDDKNQNRYINDNVSTRFGITLGEWKGFKLQANMGYDVTNISRDQFMTPDFGDAQQVGGRAYKTRARNESYTINELLTYANSFGRNNIDVLAGHENYKMTYAELYNEKHQFFDSSIPEFNNAIIMDDMESSTDRYAIESYFGRLNYNFDDRYYLSASVRGDGSSRFAKGHRWGTFWSVGGSWRITKEAFMQNVNWLDNLSIRASYGSVGNDDIYYPNTSSSNYYPTKTQYQIVNSDGSFSLSRFYQGNENLTWETSYNFNLGLSAMLFNDILNFDVEYFHKRTKDMLYNVPQPPSSGVSYISENALTMINQGVEFTLNVNIPMPKDFTWSWTFTGTHYRNKVTDIPADKRKDGITHDAFYNIREGRSVYDFYYYKFAGLNDEGKSTWYVDVTDDNGNVTGVETTDDYSTATKYYIGTALPDFTGGITTNFTWKGLDFSIAGNYQFGGKIYDSMYIQLMGQTNAGHNWHKDILNSWTPENTNTDVPKLDGDQNANTFSDKFLVGADYFNLRNITLGYTFPASWTRKANIEKLRIYINADNVAICSKRKGMDPRQYIAGQSDANYSVIRTVSGGVSLTF